MSKTPSNKKENKGKDVSKRQSNTFSRGKALFLISSVLTGLASFYIYNVLTTPPEMPEMDLNFWWGPYPMNPKQDLSIRAFNVEFSEVMVNDLKERLLHRRPFQPPLENAGFTYGFNSNFLTRVLDYWQNSYDFKAREKFLNKYDQFVTNIQGLDIHFIHVKPKVSSDIAVVPIIILHGWPGSVREFYEMIPKLTTPRPGYKFVFEIIAPSLPGYGFSQAAARPGLGVAEVAVIMRNLMERIGHKKYYVHGGDWGGIIASNMATLFPENILGHHTNIPTLMNHPLGTLYIWLGSFWPSLVVEPELESRLYPFTDHLFFSIEESGYLHIQSTKPDTVGVALTDSPAGLAAYILEKFSTWTNRENKRAADGNLLSKFTLTHLLDNVMIYWSTNSITTSMRLYSESFNKRQFAMKIDQIPTEVPTWGMKFKHEIMYQPDFVLKLKYKNYLHSTIVEDGGHFAAFELPDVVADDMFEAIEAFRQFHSKASKEDNVPASTTPKTQDIKTIYDFAVKDIQGKDVRLDRYKGHVCIMVNVASQCGLTENNYRQLNELYEKYSKSRGLRILAFPCNQFGSQEPGSSQEILKFTKEQGVKFDLFEKIEVNGENAHPLWKFLKQTQSGTMGDFIKWNFSKFIVDKNGVPVERFGPNVDPLELESYLAKYW